MMAGGAAMTILIVYGTVEGQTRKIAEFVETRLRDAGKDVVLFDTADLSEDITFDKIDKVILAASVHERRHPKAFEIFISGSSAALSEKPTLLLSVSLKAAFADGQDEAQDYLDEMKLRTGFAPSHELLVAGAIRSASYDFYASQVLRHVVLDGQTFDPSVRDREFTDWNALAAGVADFVNGDTAS
jgi:menaquinone-dependent protoporphyrinogen oxidase